MSNQPIKFNGLTLSSLNQEVLNLLLNQVSIGLISVEAVIHKDKQWIKFSKNNQYFLAIQVISNEPDYLFLDSINIPF